MTKHVLYSLLFLLPACTYLPDAETDSPTRYELIETEDYVLLNPKSTNTASTGLLFIPGGLVDPHAYIKTFEKFVYKNDMKVLIVKVRGNLAIFNSKQASRVRNEFSDTKWFVGGHSLGGVVAAMAVGNETKAWEGLFLMGSYSVTDVSTWQQPVISFLAENDGLTKPTDIADNAGNLPEGITIQPTELQSMGDTHGKTVYYTIAGGNHGQFGSYGKQEGDGEATITADMQHDEIYRALVNLLRNNGYDI
ncbi:hypothetical protein GC194_10495 [bacterium]|nr:hypothetical protein [bacterium]